MCLDFEKAFDTVDRRLLFQKMIKMGIPPSLIEQVKIWLTDRKCVVKVGSCFSKQTNSHHGHSRKDPC